MSDAGSKSAAWAEANRLLGALASSVGNAMEARLGDGVDSDDWQERAAIMEYNGGLPREAAERFARELAALWGLRLRRRLWRRSTRDCGTWMRGGLLRPRQGRGGHE